MRVKLHPRSILAALLLVVLMASISVARAAEPVPDLTQKGSLTVTLRDAQSGAAMSGGELTLYRVAEAVVQDGGMTYQFVNGFENCGLSLKNLEDSALAAQLAEHRTSSAAGQAKTPDANGQLTYTELSPGLYLLVQTQAADGFETIQPFVAALPMQTESGWVYDVDASPKVGVKKTDTPQNPQTPATPQTPGTRLPQTGQLNWPIPVLSIVGLTLLGAGWLLRKKGMGK